MESVQHLQQIPCNTFHHTLILLLHYLAKLKRFIFAANIPHYKQHAFIFACTHFSGSRLLTYYCSLWFLLNIFLNNKQFYVNKSKCWQLPCKLGMSHGTSFREGYTFYIGPDLGPRSGLLQDMWCHPAASFFSCECITWTNRTCAC